MAASGPTFADIAERYLDHLEPEIALSTWLSYRGSLNRYWLPLLGSAPIGSICYLDLLRLWDVIDFPSRKTAKNKLVPLNGVFAYAFERGIIDANPAQRLRVRRTQRPRVDPFTASEKERILRRLEDHESVVRQFFLTNFETGARTGELLALTWGDYDGRGLTINKSITRRRLKASTKTGLDRYVFCTHRLRNMLNSVRSSDSAQYLFRNTKGGPMMDADWLNIRWRAALAAERIRYRRAYNCRHTYATLGLMAGLEPGLLAQQLGHGLDIFHRNYARWLPREADEAEILRMEDYWRDME